MPAVKTQETKHLHAYFTEKDFKIDVSGDKPDESLNEWIAQFEEDKYRALFHLGFKEKAAWFTPSLDYIYHIAELLIKKISQQPDLEFSRETVQVDLSQDELNQLKEMLPFVIGMEYV
ncbi:MAG: ATP-dependent helicase, partial [Clostridiaceae bacterium]|nr:ATP-dependent helicase [Clostridiaceae bacterium]